MKNATLIASALILVTFLLVPVIATSQNSQSISSYGTVTSSPTDSSTKIKKMLLAWGASSATSLVQLMQRSSTGWDLIFMDGPTGLAPSLVAAVKAAYPSIKVLTSVSVVSIANAGYDDYNTTDSNYWGYQVLNPYNQYKYVGYDGVFLDDYYPTLKTNGPSENDLIVLSTWLRARLPNAVMVIPDWHTGIDPQSYLFIHSFDNPNYPFQEANIDQIATATSAGRAVVIGPFTESSYGGTAYQDTLAECTFTLAHFLCGLDGNNGYTSWGAIYTASGGWYSIMDTDPGTPLNAYQTSGSWIYRNFTKCNVQANLATRTGIITVLP